jgi:hypothetical protein
MLTPHVFPQFQEGLAAKRQALASDTIKVALGNAAGPITLATAGVQAAKLLSDWTAIVPEITGTGYTAGGATLADVTSAVAGNVWTLTATSPVWPEATLTANQAVFYDADADTVQLIAFWDFGEAVSSTANDFELAISESGIVTATVS